MNEADRKARNAQMLQQLYPTFRAKIAAVIADLEGHGHRPRIQCAWRSPQEQREAYESGHSKLLYGFHNVTGADGRPEALAVDLLDDDHPNQEGRLFLLQMASSAESHGCVTGVRWGVPAAMAQAIDAAIARKDWDAPVKVGWDPCHIQPAGMTAREAKAGRRP